MTVAELIEELKTKPPTYRVRSGDSLHGALIYEVATDHEDQSVIIY
jgi:hypothetical protein